MMYTLLVLTVLAQPQPPPAAPSGTPPEQVLASIDAKGKLTLTHVSCNCYGSATQENTVTAHEIKGDDKVPVQVKVKVTSVSLTTVELPAKFVQAYTATGTTI